MTKYRSIKDAPVQLILKYIKTYQKEHGGVSPSVREIRQSCYLANATVIAYLALMESWGVIEREHGMARGIHVLVEDEDEK